MRKQLKKNISGDKILEEITSLYSVILPLLWQNPKRLDPADELKKRVRKIVPFDVITFLMQDPNPPFEGSNFVGIINPTEVGNKDGHVRNIFLESLPESNVEDMFKRNVQKGYLNASEQASKDFPNNPHHDFYRIISSDYPKVMIGFLRTGKTKTQAMYSFQERQRFQSIMPHLINLYKVIYTIKHFQAPEARYIEAHLDVCAQIVNTYKLSNSEARFVPDILFGASNEKMAEKHFVAIDTVKKHLKGIYKKTQCKNRLDFIGKFFTSPERVILEPTR